MEEDDIEYKQNFLRTQIIDEGYDPEIFSKFLSDEKGENGLDLNNWKFEDLKNAVIKFKSMKSNEQNNIENIQNENENSNFENLENENNKKLENNNQSEKIKNEENSLQNEIKEDKLNIIKNSKNEIDTFEIMPSLSEIKTVKEYINCNKQEKNEFTEIENFKIKISK